jgi:hypothetical protein
MPRKILQLILTTLVLSLFLPTAFAADFEDINRPEVFLKQENSGTCTLASTAMMLRRTAMMAGNPYWSQITESTTRESFWRAGRGLPYTFAYDGITVNHAFLPGGEANRQVLIDVLAQHPEGVMLHAAGVPHGVLLTDYTDGVFYCADPSVAVAEGRIPITQAYGTRIENSTAYWFVTSPDVKLTLPAEEILPRVYSAITEESAPLSSTTPLALVSNTSELAEMYDESFPSTYTVQAAPAEAPAS